jgi:protocatechuate 3,4-dioxygenase beta subunit
MTLEPTSRRRFLGLAIALPATLALLARHQVRAAAAAGGAPDSAGVAPTPECGDDDEPTPRETEGPFFKPRSPLRASLLEPGMAGTRIALEGGVYTRHCRPVAGALVDFWHADAGGEYDNAGFRCRGHQFTDAKGRYRLETVVPGLYPGRTRHFHVKVQAPHGKVLTTQLYFPGEARNAHDGLFRSDLLMALDDAAAGKQARFHFVLDAVPTAGSSSRSA